MRLALAEPRITFAAAANPATLIGAVRLADGHKENLLRDIAEGTLTAPGAVPPSEHALLFSPVATAVCKDVAYCSSSS